jgi:DNA primase catalytic subunit
MNAYFTPTEWLDPSNVRRSRGRAQDYLLSSPLYFDLETKEAHIKGSIHLTLELIDYMERAYGRTPSWIIFSGRRGFHVYYWDWDDIVKEYGNPRDRLHQFIKSRKAIMKELDRASIKVDTTVTPDPWRVMRIPGTLHGKTGLVAVPVSDPSKFTIDCAKITS